MQNYNNSIILTIHNKEDLIEKVFYSIIENVSINTKEIILVFDGCSDNSEKIIDNIPCQIPIKKIYTPDIFETRANNAGLKNVNSKYSILIQDDVIIKEKNFDERLIKPLLSFDDVFAVSARNAHNILYNNINLHYKDLTGPEYNTPRDLFCIRSVINRGPIAIDNEVLNKIGLLDEDFSPNAFDDFEICLRANKLLNKKCGSYIVDFESKPEWGTGRKKNQNLHAWSHRKNSIILFLKYRDLIKNIENYVEERYLG